MQPQAHDADDPEEMNQADSQEQSSLPMDRTSSDQSDEQDDLLGEIVVTHTSKEQLKVNIFGNFQFDPLTRIITLRHYRYHLIT